MDVLQCDDLSFPRSLAEFQRLFPDDMACADFLAVLTAVAGQRDEPEGIGMAADRNPYNSGGR